MLDEMMINQIIVGGVYRTVLYSRVVYTLHCTVVIPVRRCQVCHQSVPTVSPSGTQGSLTIERDPHLSSDLTVTQHSPVRD